MPFVNVYAKNVVRGLKRPFVGTKKNVNLSEEDIKICKLYGAEVEYINSDAKVETTEAKETTEDNKDSVEAPVSDEKKEDVEEKIVETTEAEETTEDNKDSVEAPVSDEKKEDATEVEVEKAVETEETQKKQNKNSTKKKNN